jgi:hypothetical protein
MAFSERVGQHLDLSVIHPEIGVQLGAVGRAGFGIGQEDLGGTGLNQEMPLGTPFQIGQTLRDKHHGGILLPQCPQPGFHLCGKAGVRSNTYAIQGNQRGASLLEPLFDAVKELEQHRDEVGVPALQQMFHLKHHEGTVTETVFSGVEQRPGATAQRIMP